MSQRVQFMLSWINFFCFFYINSIRWDYTLDLQCVRAQKYTYKIHWVLLIRVEIKETENKLEVDCRVFVLISLLLQGMNIDRYSLTAGTTKFLKLYFKKIP